MFKGLKGKYIGYTAGLFLLGLIILLILMQLSNLFISILITGSVLALGLWQLISFQNRGLYAKSDKSAVYVLKNKLKL